MPMTPLSPSNTKWNIQYIIWYIFLFNYNKLWNLSFSKKQQLVSRHALVNDDRFTKNLFYCSKIWFYRQPSNDNEPNCTTSSKPPEINKEFKKIGSSAVASDRQ
jgi:hypothetical protein